MEQGTLPSATKTYVVYPDRVRVEAEVQGAQTVQIFNAGTGWVKKQNGFRRDMTRAIRRRSSALLRTEHCCAPSARP